MTTTSEVLAPPAIETTAAPPPPESQRKLRGKIAALPKSQRDQINRLLDDGATYKHVIETMQAEHGVALNHVNIHNWFKSGFQDYVRHQEFLAEVRSIRDGACDMLEQAETLKLHQAANQLAVVQIFKSLRDDTLKEDHVNRIRSMNALCRLSREALVYQKYEEARAKEQQTISLPQLDENRPLNENEENIIQDRWDRVFKIHPNHRRSKTPITPEPEVPGEALSSTSKGRDDFHVVPNPSPTFEPAASAAPSHVAAGVSRRDFTAPESLTIPCTTKPEEAAAEKITPSTITNQPEITRPSAIDSASTPLPYDAPLFPNPPPAPAPTSPLENQREAELRPKNENSSLPSFPSVNSDSEIRPNPPVLRSAHAKDGCPSALENPPSPAPLRSAICDLRSEPPCENSPLPIEATQPQIENQPETELKPQIENPLDLCPECGTPAPLLLPSGDRPDAHCKHCGLYLPPPPQPASQKAVPELSHAE